MGDDRARTDNSDWLRSLRSPTFAALVGVGGTLISAISAIPILSDFLHRLWVLELTHGLTFFTSATTVLLVCLVALAFRKVRQHYASSHGFRILYLTAVVLSALVASHSLYSLTGKPRLSVKTQVSIPGEVWRHELTAKPGDEVSALISYTNVGRGIADEVLVGNNLPPHVKYVTDSSALYTSQFPVGTGVENGVTIGRLRVGNYLPQAGGHIKFKIRLNSKMSAGPHRLTNVGVASVDGVETWDTAVINVRQK